jgi:NitT/TauT family transport system substrate-binding protein
VRASRPSASRFLPRLIATLSALALTIGAGQAAESLRLAVGAPGNWDTCIPAIGQRAGIFKKHGIEVELLYTQGGGETMQAVISGSVDIGIAAGTGAVMGAFAKGAPVRIIAAGVTGASDLYWYVPAGSPIQSFKDAAGKTVAYSTNGASTHITLLTLLTLLALLKHYDVKARLVATGASAVTFTQAMSGQVDVGWASPPFGLDALDDGRIRLIARGSDVPATAGQTVRVHIANAAVLAARPDAIDRFMQAYRESYAFLYGDPRALTYFADLSKVSEKLAGQIRDTFLPKQAMAPDNVSGIDASMADAIAYKMLAAPLRAQQLDTLIRIPPPH